MQNLAIKRTVALLSYKLKSLTTCKSFNEFKTARGKVSSILYKNYNNLQTVNLKYVKLPEIVHYIKVTEYPCTFMADT